MAVVEETVVVTLPEPFFSFLHRHLSKRFVIRVVHSVEGLEVAKRLLRAPNTAGGVRNVDDIALGNTLHQSASVDWSILLAGVYQEENVLASCNSRRGENWGRAQRSTRQCLCRNIEVF